MKKKSKNQVTPITPIPALTRETLAAVRGGRRGGEDDDPNGSIVIIGRDGP